jgi:8-oxo-dGTP diphosphatase
MNKLVLVVAAALVDPQHRVLMAERPPGKSMAGLWEFPGGKVEAGETPEATLIRELDEELAITVAAGDLHPLTFASHAYERFHLLMPLFLVRRWAGEPQGREGQSLRWVDVEHLAALPMPAADIPLVAAIRRALAAADASTPR